MVHHGPQLIEIAEVAQFGRMCMTSGEHENTEKDHTRENQYPSHLHSPHAALSNRHVAPCGTMRPTPGVGKCAGMISVSLPAYLSRNAPGGYRELPIDRGNAFPLEFGALHGMVHQVSSENGAAPGGSYA
jgi:hypothetical protein